MEDAALVCGEEGDWISGVGGSEESLFQDQESEALTFPEASVCSKIYSNSPSVNA
jgi:hypothetical protein